MDHTLDTISCWALNLEVFNAYRSYRSYIHLFNVLDYRKQNAHFLLYILVLDNAWEL